MCLAIMNEDDFPPGVITTRPISDTEFTVDDFRQVVLTSLPIRHLIDPAMARLLLPIQISIVSQDI